MMPIPAGKRRHLVYLDNPTQTSDGDGGYTQAWESDVAGCPAVWVKITPATARDLERVAGGGVAVQSSASHIVTGPYHAGVSTKTRLLLGSRIFQVTGVANVDEIGAEMVMTCTEVVA